MYYSCALFILGIITVDTFFVSLDRYGLKTNKSESNRCFLELLVIFIFQTRIWYGYWSLKNSGGHPSGSWWRRTVHCVHTTPRFNIFNDSSLLWIIIIYQIIYFHHRNFAQILSYSGPRVAGFYSVAPHVFWWSPLSSPNIYTTRTENH